jgi:amino acid transporter
MSAPKEPRNPFYLLLLIVGLIFIVTVLAYAVIPVIEQKAMDAGQMPPPSPFRDALRQDGWKWVLVEVALLVVLGLMSMGLDRWRRWKQESANPDTTKVESPPPGS